jgi:hypothetical protein
MVVPLPPYQSIYWTEPQLCNYTTCPLDPFGQLYYRPNLGGNALYLAIFVLGLLIAGGLSVKYKTWGYLAAIIGGAGLEIIGYIGRIMLWQDDFNNNNFIIYLVGLTIGPAFFSAAIYLCLARIIAIYGPGLSILTPRLIAIFFVGSDFLSLVLQAAGGAIASTANTHATSQVGINLMIAGLSTQVVSMTAFVLVCMQLAWAVRKHPERVSTEYEEMRRSRRFRLFLWCEYHHCSSFTYAYSLPILISSYYVLVTDIIFTAIGICTIAILIRCSFRVAELSKGFNGSIANNEVEFMVLDGMLMSIVIILLTVAHPGIILGPMWQAGGFHLRKSKADKTSEKEGSAQEVGSI